MASKSIVCVAGGHFQKHTKEVKLRASAKNKEQGGEAEAKLLPFFAQPCLARLLARLLDLSAWK